MRHARCHITPKQIVDETKDHGACDEGTVLFQARLVSDPLPDLTVSGGERCCSTCEREISAVAESSTAPLRTKWPLELSLMCEHENHTLHKQAKKWYHECINRMPTAQFDFSPGRVTPPFAMVNRSVAVNTSTLRETVSWFFCPGQVCL